MLNYKKAIFIFLNLFLFVATSFAGNFNLFDCNYSNRFSGFRMTGDEMISSTITRNSSDVFYMNDDVSPEKRAQYALYEIENTGAASMDVYVRAGNFSGDIRLADNETGDYHIGILAPGEKGYAYFYFGTDLLISGQNQTVTSTNTHDISVYDGDPNSGGILDFSSTFNLDIVQDVIKANANKVEGLSISGSTALDSTFTITVTGATGTIGSAKVANFSAATNMDWPAGDFKLINTTIAFTKVGGGSNANDGLFLENDLNFLMLDTKNTEYEVKHTFKVISAGVAVSGYEPVSYISSGNEIKHSVLDGGVTVPEIPSGAAPTSTISGFVWSDDDYDGIKQSGESKMNGVKVRLLDTSGNQLETTNSSGALGGYEFTDIAAGDYSLRFDRNDRFVATKQDAGSDETADSDVNRATRMADITVVAGVDIEISAGFTPDFDRDLIPDIVEISGGVTDYEAVDPAGYIYFEDTGEILPDGYIAVTGPGAINIVDTGNVTGYYSWLIDGTPGTYTMVVTPPPGYEASVARLPSATFDPTGLTPDPYAVGSPDSEPNGFLDDFTFGANTFYMTFDLAAGDPFVIDNNIPLKLITPLNPTDTACTSMAMDTFFTNVIAGATSYNWTAPIGATITQLPSDTMIVVDWTTIVGTIPRAGSVCVSGVNSCGAGTTSCVDIYIKDCNVAPVALKDSLSVAENSTGNSILVQANDLDADNDILTTTILDLPTSGGTASVVNGDSLVYAPPTDFFGLDTIRYRICDPDNLCDTALVIINVLNDPCSPQDLANLTVSGATTKNTSIALAADAAATGFTGTWSVVVGSTGSENFSNANDENATVNGLVPGVSYTLRWTVTCDTDSGVTSFEEVSFCILSTVGAIMRR